MGGALNRGVPAVVLAAIILAMVGAVGPSADAAEVTFGPHHEMLVDGKLTLPVHAWATATKDLDRLKAMGVNVAYLSGTAGIGWTDLSEKSLKGLQTFLDECGKRDMLAVLNVEAWFKNPQRRGILKDKTLADFMGKFKEHPALLGWHISTEDDMGLGRAKRKEQGIGGWAPRPNGTPADLATRFKEVKRIDPGHPVLVMFSGGQLLAADRKFGWTVPTPETWYFEAAKQCDILYHDLFPVANNTPDDLKQIADATDLLVKYAAGKKHLWVAVDAGDRKRWSTKSHAPTGKEIRNELWQAVIHGAHGLGFDYTSWKPTWASIRMSEDGEKGLTAAVKEIQGLKEAILLGRTTKAAKVASTGDGAVHATLREHSGKLYVFAANVESKPCQVQLALPVGARYPAQARAIGEGRTAAIAKGAIADTFEPYAVHLYAIEP